MVKPDPTHTKIVKDSYRGGTLNFVNTVYELRQIGHTPAEASKIVYELIKEKHNEDHTR